MTTSLPTLRVPADACLPDNAGWTNRFEIRSSTSNRVYRIAQSKTGRHWGCSCPAWIYRGRDCKHLRTLGLPGCEVPHEIALEAVK
jgi:hypothetical protein